MADNDKLLSGKRVLVTRAAEQARALVELLSEQGADVIVIPTFRIELIHPSPAFDHCLRRLPYYQWLVLTSANGVTALAARTKELQISPEAFAHMQCVAVGAATADAMRALGLRVDIVPEEYVAESVVAAIKHQVSGKNVLLIRGTLARDVIPRALEEAGAWVDTADAYRTVIPADSEQKVREVFLSATPPEIVTFTSSSTVDNFIRLMTAAGFSERPAMLRAASIGSITSRTLREHGWEPWVEAKLHTTPGLVESIMAGMASSGALT
jgi:uroporphyrinogen-III synthase